jgi:large subunit ribosomal protein L18
MAMQIVGRERRKLRIRRKISGTQQKPRLTVFRSAKHIYAQVVDDVSGSTLAHASTLSRDVRSAVAEGKAAAAAPPPAPAAEGEAKPEGKEGKKEKKEQRPRRFDKTEAAKKVGVAIAKLVLAKGIDKVVFDRNGYLYHGRVQALADAARKTGLKF